MNGDDYSDDLGDSLDADLVDLDLGDLDLGLGAAPPDGSNLDGGSVVFDRSWRPVDHSWGETEETHGGPAENSGSE